VSLEPAVDGVRRAVTGLRRPLVLVDGPSGAGKTTFAEALVRAWPGRPPRVVRVDEAIPGWHGLQRGAASLGRSLLIAHARGSAGAVHRWDWDADRSGRIGRFPPGPTIVEGCGAFLAGFGRPDAVRVWMDAPYAVRRRRALDRDRGGFDPHWEAWEADWRRYLGGAGVGPAGRVAVRLGDRVAARRDDRAPLADYGGGMADAAAATYVAEFIDGPLEGDFEQRSLVQGEPEKRVGMVAAVDGLESLFWYDAVDQREVNGQIRVRFRFDADDSDPVEHDDEND
jgi:hypothetical protein